MVYRIGADFSVGFRGVPDVSRGDFKILVGFLYMALSVCGCGSFRVCRFVRW